MKKERFLLFVFMFLCTGAVAMVILNASGTFAIFSSKEFFHTENPCIQLTIEDLSKTAENSPILIPGTNGSFEIEMKFSNLEQIATEAEVSLLNSTGAFAKNADVFDQTSFRMFFSEKKYDSPSEIPFETEGVSYQQISDALEETLIRMVEPNTSKILYIYWEWPYEGNTDEADTLFSNYVYQYKRTENTASKLSLAISVTATQVA